MKSALTVIIVLSILMACGPTEEEQAQQEQRQLEMQQQQTSDLPYNFRMEMDTVLNRYFALKDAFVESESQRAAEEAEALSDFTAEVMDEILDAEERSLWLAVSRIIRDETENLLLESELEEQRIYFERISTAMIRMVESYNPVNYSVYHLSCTGEDDQDAEWLSREETYTNPYQSNDEDEESDCETVQVI